MINKLIVTSGIILLCNLSYGQSSKALTNEENTFIIVLATSSKCEIFYSSGTYEEVHGDSQAAKLEGADMEEMTNSKVIGNILKEDWSLHSITNDDGSVRFYFTRK